jgi:hypothetical protein
MFRKFIIGFKIALNLLAGVVLLFIIFGFANWLLPIEVKKNFGYSKEKFGFRGGIVSAKWEGTWKDFGEGAIKESPYELFLWFEANQNIDGNVKVSKIKLLDDKDKVVFEDNQITEKAFENDLKVGKSHAYMMPSGDSAIKLDLDHVAHKMIVDFEATTGEEIVKDKAILYFGKKYSELPWFLFHRLSGLWDSWFKSPLTKRQRFSFEEFDPKLR